MGRLIKNLFAVAILLLVHSPSQAFELPERLVFDISWQGIPAGTAVLSIMKTEKGKKIISTAESNKFVSFFYRVEDRIVSDMEEDLHPLRYHLDLQEGSNRKDKEIFFKRSQGKAQYLDHRDNESKDFDIPKDIYDPMSAFYSVRLKDLKVGESVFITIFDSKKVWDLEVQVLRKEQLETIMGVFDTVVIKPLMKSEGIFSRKGDIYIWLTDDKRKIPLKVSSKIKIGTVDAILIGGSYWDVTPGTPASVQNGVSSNPPPTQYKTK